MPSSSILSRDLAVDLFSSGSAGTSGRERLLTGALALFTVWGLATKLSISLFLPLNSDYAGMGLLSLEIGRHHNVLLTGYHLFASDPYVTTELPLQLLPQILTGYSPVALKMVIFFVFVLSIGALAYLIFTITNNRLSALLFCALAAAIPPGAYMQLAYPTSHNVTVLAGAVILILLFSLRRAVTSRGIFPDPAGARRKKKKTDGAGTPVLLWVHVFLIVILTFLSVFSDTIILVWVLVPFSVAYLYIYRTGERTMAAVIGVMAAASAGAYALKTYFMPDWIKIADTVRGVRDILLVNIPLLFRALAGYLNTGLAALADHAAAAGPGDILSLLLFAVVVILCAREWQKRRTGIPPEQQLLYLFIAASVLLMSAAFLVSGYAFDMGGARYLTFPAILILVWIALTCPVADSTGAACVLLLLMVSAVTGSIYAGAMDKNPNAREYDLISYLRGQNLTSGYAVYWDANIVTYLSGEDVTLRSVYVLPGDLRPFLVNAGDQWYTGQAGRPFFLYDRSRPGDESQMNYPLLKENATGSDILAYRDFEILRFHPS